MLSAIDMDTLDDLVLYFKTQREPFYFEAPVSPGVTVVVNWEDEEAIDEPTQILQLNIDLEAADRYPGPMFGDRTPISELGDWWMDVDDELGMMMDGHFRRSINDSQTPMLRYVPEWSSDTHHIYATDVPIRRSPLRVETV